MSEAMERLKEVNEQLDNLDAIFSNIWADKNRIINAEEGYEVWGLFKSREVAICIAHAKAGVEREHSHEEKEWIFVIQGELKINMLGASRTLHHGEWIEIPSSIIHTPEYLKESLVLAITMPPNEHFPEGLLSWKQVMGRSTNGETLS